MSTYKFTRASQDAINKAVELCEEGKNTQITPVHIGLALEADADGFLKRLLAKAGHESTRFRDLLKGKLAGLPKQDPPPDHVAPDSKLLALFKAADALKKSAGDSFIAVDHLIGASFQDPTL